MNRSAEQTNRSRTASRFTRFVCPVLRFIPHEPRKKDTHSLNSCTKELYTNNHIVKICIPCAASEDQRSTTDVTVQQSKIEKVPRGIRGEKSSKDMASSRNLVSTIGALASP